MPLGPRILPVSSPAPPLSPFPAPPPPSRLFFLPQYPSSTSQHMLFRHPPALQHRLSLGASPALQHRPSAPPFLSAPFGQTGPNGGPLFGLAWRNEGPSFGHVWPNEGGRMKGHDQTKGLCSAIFRPSIRPNRTEQRLSVWFCLAKQYRKGGSVGGQCRKAGKERRERACVGEWGRVLGKREETRERGRCREGGRGGTEEEMYKGWRG